MNEEKKINEFTDLGTEESEVPSEARNSTTIDDGEDLIDSRSGGIEYDFSKASDRIAAPPRINLDGKVVVIKDAKILLPEISIPWAKTRDGKWDVKPCNLKLFYDFESQVEFYSGVKVFKKDNGKYSDPAISNTGDNQASALKVEYAKFKEKNINEVSQLEFLSFLKSYPKARLKAVDFTNPKTKTVVKKNMVEEFIH